MRIVIGIIIVLTLVLTGCTSVMKYDQKIGLALKEMNCNMSTNCRAGFAKGISSGSNIDTALQATLEAMEKYAVVDDDYKDCFSKGAYISFAAHGTGDILGKVVSQISSICAIPIK